MASTDEQQPEGGFGAALAGVESVEGSAARIAELMLAGAQAQDDMARWAELAEVAKRLGLRDGWLAALADRAEGSPEAAPHADLAHALAAVGDTQKSKAELDRALVLAPDTLAWRAELVQHEQASENLEAALAHLAILEADPRIAADAPDAAWVRTMQSVTLGALGRLDAALKVATACDDGALAPTHPMMQPLALRTARSMLEAGRFADAIVVVDRVLNAGVAGAGRAQLLFEKLRAMFALGQFAELVPPATELLALAGDEATRAHAQLFLGFGHEAAAGGLPEAETAARAALASLPENPDRQLVRLCLGRVLTKLDRFDDAVKVLREVDDRLLDRGQHGEREFLIGMALLRAGKAAEALAALERASTLLPQGHWQIAVQSWLGHALIAAGRPGDAATVFEKLAQAVPAPLERANALFSAARAREAAQEPGLAFARAEAALEAIDAEQTEPARQLRSGTWMMRARIELSGKKYEAAIEAIDHALLAWPEGADDLDVVEQRWAVLLQASRFDEAAAFAGAVDARASLAGHPYVGVMRSEAERQAGRSAKAHDALVLAAEVPERFAAQPKAWYASAMANIGLVRMDAALASLARLGELDPAAHRSPLMRFWKVLARASRINPDNAQDVLDDLDAAQSQLAGPVTVLAMLARGNALTALKRYAEAGDALAAVPALVKQTPGALPNWSVQAHWLRSSALFAQGQKDEALDAMQDALAVQAGPGVFDKAFQSLIRLQRSAMRLLLDRAADGLADAHLARLEFQALRQEQGLRADFWQRSEREAALHEIDGLLRLARNEEALAAAERLARDAPSRPRALLLQGSALMRLQDWHRALATFIQARKHAGDDSDPSAIQMHARLQEAAARQKISDHEHAVLTLQQALSDHEDTATADPWFWLLLGTSYFELGRLEPARAALERAGRCADDASRAASPSLRSQIALKLSAVLVKLGSHEAAIRAIDEAGDAGTLATGLAYNRGVACLEQYRESRDMGWLLRAKESLAKAAADGHRAAGDALRQLERKTDSGGSWFDYWFGEGVQWGRLATGAVLAALAFGILFVVPIAAFWTSGEVDWKVLPVPALGALLLFLLPGIKNLSLAWGDLKVSAEPMANADGAAAAALPSLIGTMVDAKPELGAYNKSEFFEIVVGSGAGPNSPLMQALSEALFTGPGAKPKLPALDLSVVARQTVVGSPHPGASQ